MLEKIIRSAFVLALTGAVFFITGCHSNTASEQNTTANDSTGAGTVQPNGMVIDTATKKVLSSVKITKTNQDSLIVATVTAGSIPDSIALNIDQVFQRVHLVIGDVRTDSLVASLSVPGTERNLRINQIIMPDGSMDGPFGNDIHYGTPQKGTYTLIIGKDNMADGQVEGPVRIYLRLF